MRFLIDEHTNFKLTHAVQSGVATRIAPDNFRTDEFEYTIAFQQLDADIRGSTLPSELLGVIVNRGTFNAGMEIEYDANGNPYLKDPTITNAAIQEVGVSATGGTRYRISFSDEFWDINGAILDGTSPASLPVILSHLRQEGMKVILANFGLYSTPSHFEELSSEIFEITGGIEDRSPDQNGILQGTVGRDLLVGDDESNRILGSDNDDTLRGGDGDDTILGDQNVFVASPGDDLISGDAGDDWLNGMGGNDFVFGGDGDDTVIGFSGRDFLSGDAGDDLLSAGGLATLFGGDGNDVLRAIVVNEPEGPGGQPPRQHTGSAQLEAYGGSGNDSITGSDLSDTLSGGEGDDRLNGGRSLDTALFSGSLPDYHINDVSSAPGGWSGVIEGPDGRDHLTGVEVFLFSGVAALVSFGGAGADEMVFPSNDELPVPDDGTLNHIVLGLSGDDRISAGRNQNILLGGEGDDTVSGNPEATSWSRLLGEAGDDLLVSFSAADELRGGSGNDTMISGLGADTISGGGGVDAVDYTAHALRDSVVQIGTDRILVDILGHQDELNEVESLLFSDQTVHIRDGTDFDDVLSLFKGIFSRDSSVVR
ncbi:calcium-binding protein [Roseivivax sp. CAU 1761]